MGDEDTFVHDLEVNSIRWCCTCYKLENSVTEYRYMKTYVVNKRSVDSSYKINNYIG